MDYSKFIGEVRKAVYKPAYLFLGKEDFLIEEGVQELVARLLKPDEKDLNLATLSNRDNETIARALSTPPLFASRRVIIIKQAGDVSPAVVDEIVRYLKIPPEDGCLILWAGEIDKRKAFSKKIEPLLDPVVCNKLKQGELASWIPRYIQRYEKSLDSEAISRLTGVNWPSLRELAGELDRLTLMIGSKPVITVADIEEMGGASFAMERWRLADAIGELNLSVAVSAVQNLQDWGIKPNQLIGDVYRVLYQLWFMRWHLDNKKIAEAKSRLDVKDFVFTKLQRQAGAVSTICLEDAIIKTLDAELSVKRGLRHDDYVALSLVIEVISLLKVHQQSRGAA